MSIQEQHSKSRFLILYASETGQAKAISEEIAQKAVQYGLRPDHFCMSLTDKRFSIEKETCVVFIVSTTGDGQPPGTAVKFFRRLNRNSLKENHLANLNYALLALGDSNYLKFAAFGRQLEYRLKALSARSFYTTGYGDDAYGIETGVDPWINNLWPALHKRLGLDYQGKNFVDCYNLKNSTGHNDIPKMNGYSEDVPSNSLSALPSLIKEIDFEKCHVPKLPSPFYRIEYDGNNILTEFLGGAVNAMSLNLEVLSNNKGIEDHGNLEFKLSIGFLTPMGHYLAKNNHNGFGSNQSKESSVAIIPNENTLIMPASPLVKAVLISGKQLTFGDDVKDTLELTFRFENEIVEYEPGDSFGFVCSNDSKEINLLLERLNLFSFADKPASLVLHENSAIQKKIPSHIPSLFSLRELLLHRIEIRAVPKKVLLRILAEYTEDEEEKLCLLFLSSNEGSSYFADLIRKPSLSILDILLHYESCLPPLERILEYLPPLKPRFYSVASSPLVDKSVLKIAFNVLKMKSADGRIREREGVCTGWLRRLSSNMLDSSYSVNDILASLTLNKSSKTVSIYKRKNQHFTFPTDLKNPVIMVGPGTGIAPFIGYLQHREKLSLRNPVEDHGETWLFFGCRYHDRDYLYREELERFLQNKTLQHLIVSHSRDVSSCRTNSRYVHENIKLYASEISQCLKMGGTIYVCGDAKHMVHDVQAAFVTAVKIGFDISEFEAKKYIECLQKKQQYVNDVWA